MAPQKTFLSGFCKEFQKNKILFLMLLPALILIIVLAYVPMFGAVIAFEDYNYGKGIFGSDWVGLKNFDFFFKSGQAWLLTKNTFCYNISFILTSMVVEMAMAIFIFEMSTKRYKRALQSIMILPYFLSWVVIGSMVYNLFSYEYGAINGFLTTIGLDRVNVYQSTGAWRYIFVLLTLWHDTGYGMIFYLAAVNGINPELYEAAHLDGAGIIKRIWHITLPLMKPTAVILLLLKLGGILKGNFQMFYNIIGNNGHLFDATDVIDTFVFRSLLTMKDYGMTAAVGLFQQLIGFVLVMLANGVARRVDKDMALF